MRRFASLIACRAAGLHADPKLPSAKQMQCSRHCNRRSLGERPQAAVACRCKTAGQGSGRIAPKLMTTVHNSSSNSHSDTVDPWLVTPLHPALSTRFEPEDPGPQLPENRIAVEVVRSSTSIRSTRNNSNRSAARCSLSQTALS